MKAVWGILIGSALLMSCQSSHRMVSNQHARTTDHLSKYSNLADALRASSGLIVSGYGASTKIIVRKGVSGVNSEPLYVVDGFPLGNRYAHANRSVNMANVASIRVLKSTFDLIPYGSLGANGVIEIKTRHRTALD
ncbi:MAG: TonB-dependent receptor plug domain-containing protein [Saprospiraceae bacterium]|nr:TonB-dependent receptor plug domain-containing protein [Saprospiraceae bacterium]